MATDCLRQFWHMLLDQHWPVCEAELRVALVDHVVIVAGGELAPSLEIIMHDDVRSQHGKESAKQGLLLDRYCDSRT